MKTLSYNSSTKQGTYIREAKRDKTEYGIKTPNTEDKKTPSSDKVVKRPLEEKKH